MAELINKCPTSFFTRKMKETKCGEGEKLQNDSGKCFFSERRKLQNGKLARNMKIIFGIGLVTFRGLFELSNENFVTS